MNSPKCEDTRLPMEGGRSWGASSDTLDFQTFQFDSIENYGPVGSERPDNTIVFTQ